MKGVLKALCRRNVTVLILVVALVLIIASPAIAKTVKKMVENTGALTTALERWANTGGGPALDLSVNDGVAPLTVNSGAGTATNLSADKLDGKDAEDFALADSTGGLPDTYTKVQTFSTNGSGGTAGNELFCNFNAADEADALLSGGIKLKDPTNQKIIESRPASNSSWFAAVKDDTSGTPAGYEFTILCADTVD